MKRPEILVVDGALSLSGRREAGAVMARLRAFQKGRSIVHVVADGEASEGFDQAVTLRGGRLAETAGTAGADGLA